MKIKNMKKGFSLVEVLLVLGFATVLIAGAFLAYSNVKSSNSANSEVQAAATMSAGIRSLYSGSPNYNGLTAKVMIDANIVPENKINAAGDGITHDLGGTDQTITITTDYNDTNFTIVYNGVPQKQCSKFISAVAPSFNQIGVGGEGVNNSDGSLDVAKMTNLCNSGTSTSVFLVSD